MRKLTIEWNMNTSSAGIIGMSEGTTLEYNEVDKLLDLAKNINRDVEPSATVWIVELEERQTEIIGKDGNPVLDFFRKPYTYPEWHISGYATAADYYDTSWAEYLNRAKG